jgi:hypothetical protein
MRRAFLAVTLGGILLTGAACDSDAKTSTDAAPAGTPSAPSASPAPDYSANTRQVCGAVEKLYSGGLEGFNTQIGKMIANKEAKLPSEATKAREAAGKELEDVGDKIKQETASAQDPALQIAGAASAAKFAQTAGDDAFFDRIKSQKDFDRAIESQLQNWLNPIAGYCS